METLKLNVLENELLLRVNFISKIIEEYFVTTDVEMLMQRSMIFVIKNKKTGKFLTAKIRPARLITYTTGNKRYTQQINIGCECDFTILYHKDKYYIVDPQLHLFNKKIKSNEIAGDIEWNIIQGLKTLKIHTEDFISLNDINGRKEFINSMLALQPLSDINGISHTSFLVTDHKNGLTNNVVAKVYRQLKENGMSPLVSSMKKEASKKNRRVITFIDKLGNRRRVSFANITRDVCQTTRCDYMVVTDDDQDFYTLIKHKDIMDRKLFPCPKNTFYYDVIKHATKNDFFSPYATKPLKRMKRSSKYILPKRKEDKKDIMVIKDITKQQKVEKEYTQPALPLEEKSHNSKSSNGIEYHFDDILINIKCKLPVNFINRVSDKEVQKISIIIE